jgi:type IV fimbrial biogenesis protein FimT
VPSFANMIASLRITAATNSFLAGLLLARSESIKRHTRVVLCKSADGSTCAEAGDWDQGWIVFQDTDDDASRSPSELLIWREPPLDAGIRLSGNSSVASYVSFAPTGGTKLASGAFQAGTLTVCNRRSNGFTGRQIVVNAVGRPRIQKVTVPAC